MTLREQLLSLADTYAAHTGRSRSTISTQMFSGGRVIDRIDAGGDLSTGNFEKALQWFSDNWPDDLAWPEDITRPMTTLQQGAAA